MSIHLHTMAARATGEDCGVVAGNAAHGQSIDNTLENKGAGKIFAAEDTKRLSQRETNLTDKEQATSPSSSVDAADEQQACEQTTAVLKPADVSEENMDTPKQRQQLPLQDQQQEACCRYRWSKVVATSSARVIFFSSAKTKDPVFLIWSEEGGAYFSDEMHVPCGDFTGHLIIEGKTYSVEEYNIRTYTFEVDLFIKDDVISDEVAASKSAAEELKFQQQQQQPANVDTYHDITASALVAHTNMEGTADLDETGIKHKTRYEDLVRQQKTALDSSLEQELATLHKSDHSHFGSSSKRLTPVGDIDKELYHDEFSPSLDVSGTTLDKEYSAHGVASHSAHKTYLTDYQQEYDHERSQVKSDHSCSRQIFVDAAVIGDEGLNSRSLTHGTRNSGRPTPLKDLLGDEYTASLDLQKSPLRSTDSSMLQGLDHQTPLTARPGSQNSRSRTPPDSRIEDVLGASTALGSSLRSMPTNELVADVLDSKTVLASPGRPFTPTSARATPDRETGFTSQTRQAPEREKDLPSSAIGSPYSPSRGMIQSSSSALRGSRERLFGIPDRPPSGDRSRNVSLSSSHPPSQCGSRTQSLNSLTSEQELAQFLDHSISSEPRSTPDLCTMHMAEPSALRPIVRSRDRPASLPTFPPQPGPSGVDRRSYTPDVRSQSTVLLGGSDPMTQQGPPFSSRMLQGSVTSSRASSRTVTPAPSVGSQDGTRESSAKVHDLEETIATLRKLLSSREQEAHELMAQIRDLREINDCLKQDLEHARNQQTPLGADELEQLFQQVRKEKEVLSAEVVRLRDTLHERGRAGGDTGFSGSSQRRDDLEAHIRELKEINGSTMQTLMKSELRIKELLKENESLRLLTSSRVHRLPNDGAGGQAHHQLQAEIHQLKEDVRTLREKNYILHEENLQLKEKREKSHTDDVRASLTKDKVLPTRGHRSAAHKSDDLMPEVFPSAASSLQNGQLPDHRAPLSSRLFSRTPEKYAFSTVREALQTMEKQADSDRYSHSSREPLKRQRDKTVEFDQRTVKTSYANCEDGAKPVSRDLPGRYQEFRVDRCVGHQRPDPNQRDVHTDRSRPDGEGSDRVPPSKADKCSKQSSEQLHLSDAERNRKDYKVHMSAERIRILEEAELDRQKRSLVAGGRGQQHEFLDQLNSRDEPSRRKKGELTLSDDSDSTAVLMSYDGTAGLLPGQREKVRASYRDHTCSQDMYLDQTYSRDKDRFKDYRDAPRSYKEVNGDDSDTATDILLSAEPGMTSTQRQHRHRKSSIGSEGSVSSLSDPEDMLRRRSRSVETKGKPSSSYYTQTSTLRPTSSTDNLGPGKSVPLSAGFRSVIPPPLATQHNKGALLQQSTAPQAALASSLTQGLRPFAPSSPADIRPDDVVKFSRQGGKLSQGVVKFVGKLPGRSDVYLGVELYKEEGKHDGMFEGVRYFKCKPNKGVFVAFNKVVMAWAPS